MNDLIPIQPDLVLTFLRHDGDRMSVAGIVNDLRFLASVADAAPEDRTWALDGNRLVTLVLFSLDYATTSYLWNHGREAATGDVAERAAIERLVTGLTGAIERGEVIVSEYAYRLSTGKAPPEKFTLGVVTATAAARAAMGDSVVRSSANHCFCRHVSGDWGDLVDEACRENDDALKNHGRIVSAYHVDEHTVFCVVTEADRTSTRLMLAEEYRPALDANI